MISPIHIITIALGTAFALGFMGKLSQKISAFIMLAAVGMLTVISAQWVYAFYTGAQETIQIYTAGFKPPYSVNLQMGYHEAVITFMINSIGLLGGIYLFKSLIKQGKNAIAVYIILLMGLNVIVLTQDMFNLFVFLEVQSIATAGMIVLHKKKHAVSSGFKYMIATGIIAGILLLGIIFAYYFTGSLNIADFINANPGVAAIISSASGTAVLFVLYKLASIGSFDGYELLANLGIITFVGSNLLGIKQKNARRLLGYSSVGQIGLLVMIIGFSPVLRDKFTFIAFTIVVAKAGLFWLAGIVKKDNIKKWSALRKKPFLLVLFGTFVFTLIGFPPFPSFFGKWELIMVLAAKSNMIWVVAILIGSFFEGISPHRSWKV